MPDEQPVAGQPRKGTQTRGRVVARRRLSVWRTGKGEDSTVYVTGLPPMSQQDARWLWDALAHVVVMPPT
jgi:hypothetical protein